MVNIAAAKRYATALFSVAKKNDKIDSIQQQLSLVVNKIQNTPNLKRLFVGQIIDKNEKKQLMSKNFNESIDEVLMNFLHLLIDKDRTNELKMIELEYIKLADDAAGICAVTVKTAGSLSAKEKEGLTQALEKKLNKKVRLEIIEDKSLIGGLWLKIGDMVYDGSVANNLAKLEKELAK